MARGAEPTPGKGPLLSRAVISADAAPRATIFGCRRREYWGQGRDAKTGAEFADRIRCRHEACVGKKDLARLAGAARAKSRNRPSISHG